MAQDVRIYFFGCCVHAQIFFYRAIDHHRIAGLSLISDKEIPMIFDLNFFFLS